MIDVLARIGVVFTLRRINLIYYPRIYSVQTPSGASGRTGVRPSRTEDRWDLTERYFVAVFGGNERT